MKKRTFCMVLALVLSLAMLVGCGGGASSSAAASSAAPSSSAPVDSSSTPAVDFSAAMITDVGGINDESFNQSAWSGMEQLAADFGVEVSFIESEKDADYKPNLDKKTDDGADIIWAIGYLMKDALGEAAEANPDQTYALVDDYFEDGEHENAIGVMFNSEHSSFLVGYAAAMTTETDHVGIVLGMESPTMARFTNGYRAGVEYAAAEMGKEITIDYVVAEAFDDPAKGKALAQKMYTDGADVIYAVAGFTGTGVIEAAKEMDKWVCGVDLDQNYLAPENVLCSGLKNVGTAVYEVTRRVMEGEYLGGTTIYMGLEEGGAGIATTGDLLASDVLAALDVVEAAIIDGTIEVPYDEAGLDSFVAAL